MDQKFGLYDPETKVFMRIPVQSLDELMAFVYIIRNMAEEGS